MKKLLGGKRANLAEMCQFCIPVPRGFRGSEALQSAVDNSPMRSSLTGKKDQPKSGLKAFTGNGKPRQEGRRMKSSDKGGISAEVNIEWGTFRLTVAVAVGGAVVAALAGGVAKWLGWF